MPPKPTSISKAIPIKKTAQQIEDEKAREKREKKFDEKTKKMARTLRRNGVKFDDSNN